MTGVGSRDTSGMFVLCISQTPHICTFFYTEVIFSRFSNNIGIHIYNGTCVCLHFLSPHFIVAAYKHKNVKNWLFEKHKEYKIKNILAGTKEYICVAESIYVFSKSKRKNCVLHMFNFGTSKFWSYLIFF